MRWRPSLGHHSGRPQTRPSSAGQRSKAAGVGVAWGCGGATRNRSEQGRGWTHIIPVATLSAGASLKVWATLQPGVRGGRSSPLPGFSRQELGAEEMRAKKLSIKTEFSFPAVTVPPGNSLNSRRWQRLGMLCPHLRSLWRGLTPPTRAGVENPRPGLVYAPWPWA